MTTEEIDIIVTAKVEEAVKEFKKLLPSIKKQLSSIKKEFDNIKIKDISAKIDIKSIQSQVKQANKKIKEAFNLGDAEIKIVGLKREISGISNEFKKMKSSRLTLDNMIDMKNYKEKLKKLKSEGRKVIDNSNTPYKKYDKQSISNFIDNYTGEKLKPQTLPDNTSSITSKQEEFSFWDILKQKIKQVKPVIEEFKASLRNGNSSKELELVKYKISEIEEKLEKAKNGEIKLTTGDIIKAEAELEKLNIKKEKLENNKNGNIFSDMFSKTRKLIPQLNGVSGITIKIKNQIKQIGTKTKQGLGHILKYARSSCFFA